MLQDPRLRPWSLLPSFPRGQGQLMVMMLGDFDDIDVCSILAISKIVHKKHIKFKSIAS